MDKIREEARKYALKYANNSMSYFGFLNGAQSEAAKELHQAGMYSEEEVIEIMSAYADYMGLKLDIWEFKFWFDENKKK